MSATLPQQSDERPAPRVRDLEPPASTARELARVKKLAKNPTHGRTLRSVDLPLVKDLSLGPRPVIGVFESGLDECCRPATLGLFSFHIPPVNPRFLRGCGSLDPIVGPVLVYRPTLPKWRNW